MFGALRGCEAHQGCQQEAPASECVGVGYTRWWSFPSLSQLSYLHCVLGCITASGKMIGHSHTTSQPHSQVTAHPHSHTTPWLHSQVTAQSHSHTTTRLLFIACYGVYVFRGSWLGYISSMGSVSAVTVESPWEEPGNEARRQWCIHCVECYLTDVMYSHFWPLTCPSPYPPPSLPPQLKTTSMHLQNIFNVPQVVSETYDLIKDGRLLEAHRKYVGMRTESGNG